MKSQALLVLLAASSSLAQGTFQNLDFEQTVIVSYGNPDPSIVQFGPAFPGWANRIGTNQYNYALYNNAALDSSRVSIIDSGWPHYLGTTAGVIDGNFTALLQAGLSGINLTPSDTTLFQSGLVPAGTQSLRFKEYFFNGAVAVSMGGQYIPLTILGSGTNYILYGADIHQWADQVTELDFTLFADRPHVNNEYAFLDSIEFSDLSVPEPSVLTLSALGVLLLTLRSLRPRSYKSHGIGGKAETGFPDSDKRVT